jgi:hypothetical protein
LLFFDLPKSGYALQMFATLVCTLLVAAEPAAKLDTHVAREMTDAIVAVNKALGLESWVVRGEEPCVDRGGLEATAKDVKADDARRCAQSAVAKGFPGLGKDYVLGLPMADIGPVTVFAIGIDDADGFGAYSCDPSRKCAPTKLTATSKQAKRLAERYQRACASAQTIWLPARQNVCADMPAVDNSVEGPAPSAKTPSDNKKPANRSASPSPVPAPAAVRK